MKQPSIDGILIKKKFGQHFLQDQQVLDKIVSHVQLTPETSVFEIGGGSGVLTRTILQQDIARLWVFEIDFDWADYLKSTIQDERLTVFEKNFLDFDVEELKKHAPWTILSNLPYNVTFPIMHKFVEIRSLIKEGVIMIQEEVAQKILKQYGKDYGFVSLYFQYHFDMRLLEKVGPDAFLPPPKVDSRLLYLKPKTTLTIINDEADFWKFIKMAFRQPRRTLANNLKSTHYKIENLDQKLLLLRAQQIDFDGFIKIWNILNS